MPTLRSYQALADHVFVHFNVQDEAPMLETLIDDINAQRERPKRLCTIGAFMETLNEEDRARLSRVLADPDITGVEIAKALAPHVKVAGTTVSRHRRRGTGNGCGCPQ